jgi:alpha-tubulin suppressor-like RCC1 family protein
MALASDGSLFTWGGGKYGQLGHNSLHAVSVMLPEQPIVLATPHKIDALEPQKLQPWQRITSIAAGSHHSAAITVAGSLMVFGRNKHGQVNKQVQPVIAVEKQAAVCGSMPAHACSTLQVHLRCQVQASVLLLSPWRGVRTQSGPAHRCPNHACMSITCCSWQLETLRTSGAQHRHA